MSIWYSEASDRWVKCLGAQERGVEFDLRERKRKVLLL